MKRPERRNSPAFEQLEAACRREGIPATVQRRIIFSALIERRDHPTVDQIYATVKEQLPGVSRTTVYRTLETFTRLGLARRTHHFAASARFEGKMEQHHHLVCTVCGKVDDYSASDVVVDELPEARRHGFTVTDYSVYFEGVCSNCKGIQPAQQKKPAAKIRR